MHILGLDEMTCQSLLSNDSPEKGWKKELLTSNHHVLVHEGAGGGSQPLPLPVLRLFSLSDYSNHLFIVNHTIIVL